MPGQRGLEGSAERSTKPIDLEVVAFKADDCGTSVPTEYAASGDTPGWRREDGGRTRLLPSTASYVFSFDTITGSGVGPSRGPLH